MARIDDYLDSYMLEHNEYSYVKKKKIRKFLVIAIITFFLCVAIKPFTRIREAYVEKFTNYAATHEELKLFEDKIELDNKTVDIIGTANTAGKYPIPIEGTVTNSYGNGHTGIDIQGEHRGNIIAIEGGVVTFAGLQNGYGNCVEIKHTDENGKTFYSFYAHLYEIDVKLNDKVKQYDVIGKEGGQPGVDSNAGNSTGHHLHFEIRTASGYGNDINPASYIF